VGCGGVCVDRWIPLRVTGAGPSGAVVYTDLFEDDLDGVAERLEAATVADGYPVGTRDGRAEVINLRPSR